MLAIGITLDDSPVTVHHGKSQAGSQRPTDTRVVGHADDNRASVDGELPCSISGAIIDHQHVKGVRQEVLHDSGHGPFLIEGRDDR